jgi:hypothetical protein
MTHITNNDTTKSGKKKQPTNLLTRCSPLKNLKLRLFFARNDIGNAVLSGIKMRQDTFLTNIALKAIDKYFVYMLKY